MNLETECGHSEGEEKDGVCGYLQIRRERFGTTEVRRKASNGIALIRKCF